MAKFKVGDRVHFTDKCPKGWWFSSEDAAVVVADDGPSSHLRYKIKVDGCAESGWDGDKHIELATPKFKVGDHVVGKSNVGDPVDGLIDRVDNDDSAQPYRVDGQWCFADDVRLADPDDAPLSIRAGGYYKTRDGRRVGPAEVFRDQGPREDGSGRRAEFYFRKQGSYTSDGVWLTGNANCEHDIVAEWSDEPAARAYTSCAAAQVDTQCDEYGAASAKPADGKPADDAMVGNSLKFKVGDRVSFDGKAAVIRETRAEHTYWPHLIEFESDAGYGHDGNGIGLVKLTSGRGWWAGEDQLSKLTQPAIVAPIEGGQPKPSKFPCVHASRALAETEAARLARLHKGQEFGVYELVSTRKEEKPAKVYDHEWQRLAASGETSEARKTLQQTGLTSMQASRVVQEFVAAA